jgi:hypothetical protein
MRKTLVPISVAGLAASALAIAGPITAHAAGTTGPCSGAGTGNPVQHTGSGHHSFTDSHNNCVNFVGVSDTAFLNDSNFNLINMAGNSDTVHDFNNSNGNTINFNAGANFDTLSASSANGDTVTFQTGSSGDVIDLLGLTNDTVTFTSGASNDFLIFTAGCGTTARTITGSGIGMAGSPITIC